MLFAMDARCEVHQSILPIREEKEGWVHHFAPGGVCCSDDGAIFSILVSVSIDPFKYQIIFGIFQEFFENWILTGYLRT